MDKGTREDYDLISIHDSENERNLVSRVIEWLKMMDGESPYKISRLQHCLQTATRAEEDGADTETIVCALLHDILKNPYDEIKEFHEYEKPVKNSSVRYKTFCGT